MNDRMQAKIETCLELTVGKTNKARAKDFKKKVLKVTGISENRFTDLGLTSCSYNRLLDNESVEFILKELF